VSRPRRPPCPPLTSSPLLGSSSAATTASDTNAIMQQPLVNVFFMFSGVKSVSSFNLVLQIITLGSPFLVQ
uniref:Uncharacterized protein n=1 Tax=Aegilops tauschii subsp. strangulata TaxID=200361 RepID=A0A453GRR0_AEGTS